MSLCNLDNFINDIKFYSNMLTENFKDAIELIYSKLKDKNIKFAFIGSANLNLQGIDVVPKDLDLISSIPGLKLISEEFKDYIIQPISKKPYFKDGYPEYYELKLKINDVLVHIMGEYDSDLYMSRINKGNVVLVKFMNISVPCLALKSEAEAYSEMGIYKKVKLIRDYLNKKTTTFHSE